jgi:hypothetical protein
MRDRQHQQHRHQQNHPDKPQGHHHTRTTQLRPDRPAKTSPQPARTHAAARSPCVGHRISRSQPAAVSRLVAACWPDHHTRASQVGLDVPEHQPSCIEDTEPDLLPKKQTLLCTYLSGVLLVGLTANSLFGWSWA